MGFHFLPRFEMRYILLLLIASVSMFAAYGERVSDTSGSVYPDNSELSGLTADSISNRISADTIATPYSEGGYRVGLVLSGGGAKGIAHVGVIKALEDNDIPIDYVTGTSMGAIVGSLYACGWSPEKMYDFFTAPDFLNWATGTINKDHILFYDEPRPSPQWVSVNLSFTKKESLSDQIIPTSLISPLPMNIEFLNLYSKYSEQCDKNFNNLFVPFRCVASDVYHKHKVVFHSGSLGEAVRASMSFPMVFRPIEVNGVLLYDGGIYDNFPVNVMEEDFSPDFMIGVSVSGADTKPVSGDMYSQVEDMIIQNNDYSLPADEGVKIQVPVLNFGVLQFDKARTIYEIGYKTGLSWVDSIKKRMPARRPVAEVMQRRDSFAAATPRVMFDSVQVEGIAGSQARYLRYLFTRGRREPFGMEQTVTSYYRAVTDGSLSNLVPEVRFGAGNKNNILLLKATPRRPWTLGVGGFVTTSTNSMLYFTAGYHTMGHNSLDVSLGAWVGQAYFAGMINAKFSIRTLNPSYFELTAVMSKQKFYANEVLFFKSSNPMFTTEIDNFIRGGYTWAVGSRMKGYASLAGGYMSDSYYPVDGIPESGNRDRVQFWAGVLRVGIEGNSLDNQLYPSGGQMWYANADLSWQSSRFRPAGGYVDGLDRWNSKPVLSIDVMWKRFFGLGKYAALGVMAQGYATLQRLNLNYTNTLAHAPAFAPTPATKNYFNLAFRSDNFLAAGLIPIWMPFKRMQVRGDFYLFAPVRGLRDMGRFENTRHDGWFHKPQFLGEIAAIYNFPFASISLYGNYLSSPSRNWNFGISFGLLFNAPKLLRRN